MSFIPHILIILEHLEIEFLFMIKSQQRKKILKN